MNRRSFHKLLTSTLVCASTMLAPVTAHAQGASLRQPDEYERNSSSSRVSGAHGIVPKLYDARGRLVGEIVTGSDDRDGGAVLLNVEGVLVAAPFERLPGDAGTRSASRMAWSVGALRYDGPDCTGTPYVASTGSPLRPATAIRRDAHVTLYIAVEGRVEDHTTVSVWEGTNCYRGYPPFVDKVWRIENSIDLSDRYPEPLRVGL